MDLGHDCAARHFVVATIIGDLITDHDGNIPADLGEVFSYLNEQNVALARSAARGAMASFMAGQMPGAARLALVKQVGDQLSRLRIVKGAIGGRR
ncbi:MAG: hypothetical protein GXP01_04665, partial [Alphaproteobacteria bacterium]|nr:hypothetical protein [Alphaproteobacteria bacterium]